MTSKRIEAIDAAVSEVDREIHSLNTKRHGLLHAELGTTSAVADVEQLAAISGQLQALQAKRAALGDLREAAEQADLVDAVRERQKDIEQHLAAGGAALRKRAALGKKVDQLLEALSNALKDVQAAGDKAAEHYSEAMRLTPISSDRKLTQRAVLSDLLSGAYAGPALAVQMSAFGVGKIGIPARVVWDYGTLYPQTVEMSLVQAAQRAETTMGAFLWAVTNPGEPYVPQPSKITGRKKHWSEMTPAEVHEAAMAAAGQRREQVEAYEDLPEGEREALAGALAASTQGSRLTVTRDGQRTTVSTERREALAGPLAATTGRRK